MCLPRNNEYNDHETITTAENRVVISNFVFANRSQLRFELKSFFFSDKVD